MQTIFCFNDLLLSIRRFTRANTNLKHLRLHRKRSIWYSHQQSYG